MDGAIVLLVPLCPVSAMDGPTVLSVPTVLLVPAWIVLIRL
jgi:hypothetical protein